MDSTCPGRCRPRVIAFLKKLPVQFVNYSGRMGLDARIRRRDVWRSAEKLRLAFHLIPSTRIPLDFLASLLLGNFLLICRFPGSRGSQYAIPIVFLFVVPVIVLLLTYIYIYSCAGDCRCAGLPFERLEVDFLSLEIQEFMGRKIAEALRNLSGSIPP